jgi:hypothetical protein
MTMSVYYLDNQLTPEEQVRRYDADGRGRAIDDRSFYATAIRKTGKPGWVFRFPQADAAAASILAELNQHTWERAAGLELER